MDHTGSSRRTATLRLFSEPPFRLFWSSVAASAVGGQFFAVALPWLVLQLSPSDVALGSVLMTAALPRAALTLLGGTLSDRVPPARVLLLVNVARAVLVAAQAALVASGLAQLWQLYPLAVAFGVLDALSGPASTAIVPSIAGDQGVAAANSMIQSTAQVGTLIAPTLAGTLVAVRGTAASFVVSAVAFILAAAACALMPRGTPGHARESADRPRRLTLAGPTPPGIMAVVRICLSDPALRAYLVLLAGLSLATSGPLGVGIPSLARVRFAGSVSLGFMLSAAGGGTLLGAILAGSRRRIHRRGRLVLGAYALIGLLLILLAYAPTVVLASLAIALMACASTYVTLVVTAKLQTEAPRAILGRIVGVVMLASAGPAPVSFMLAGFASAVDPAVLFCAAGAGVLAATARAALSSALRRVE